MDSRWNHFTKDPNATFIVRQYDQFDGWIDITGPLSLSEAVKKWNDSTNNGTKNTKYSHGYYYDIFPSNTRMIMTPESLGR